MANGDEKQRVSLAAETGSIEGNIPETERKFDDRRIAAIFAIRTYLLPHLRGDELRAAIDQVLNSWDRPSFNTGIQDNAISRRAAEINDAEPTDLTALPGEEIEVTADGKFIATPPKTMTSVAEIPTIVSSGHEGTAVNEFDHRLALESVRKIYREGALFHTKEGLIGMIRRVYERPSDRTLMVSIAYPMAVNGKFVYDKNKNLIYKTAQLFFVEGFLELSPDLDIKLVSNPNEPESIQLALKTHLEAHKGQPVCLKVEGEEDAEADVEIALKEIGEGAEEREERGIPPHQSSTSLARPKLQQTDKPRSVSMVSWWVKAIKDRAAGL